MKTVLSIFGIIAILVASSMSVSAADEQLQFKYVGINVDGSDGLINLTMANGSYFAIEFTKVAVGGLERGHMPSLWYANIYDMNSAILNGTNSEMGKYIHIKMWKTLTLHSPMQTDTHSLSLTLDFYISSKNYTKGSVRVDRNTLRYDVHIVTDCPGQYVFLEHRVMYPGSQESSVYENAGQGWKSMQSTMDQKMMNFTHHAELGFGSDRNISFKYEWYSDTNFALYSHWGDEVTVSFVYANTGNIVQDPYVHLPFPIYVPSEQIHHVVSYFMDHLYSVMAGIGVAVGIIMVPVVLRRR